MKDTTLRRLLLDPEFSREALTKALKGQDGADTFLATYKDVFFKSLDYPGYCVVPAKGAGSLVVVLRPSPDALQTDIVGTWPEGSSPDVPGCKDNP